MSTVNEAAGSDGGNGSGGRTLVDPRAPRLGQGITAAGLALGIALREPIVVFVMTGLLVVAVVSRWRLDPYALLWRHVVSRLLDPPTERESAAPHRFAKLLGALFTTVASLLLVAGTVVPFVTTAGYVVAAAVVVLAIASSVFDYCVGCQMYREVAFFRRRGWI
ncbi:MAG: DUF4395 domain-containing protein [Natronomonas sp.]